MPQPCTWSTTLFLTAHFEDIICPFRRSIVALAHRVHSPPAKSGEIWGHIPRETVRPRGCRPARSQTREGGGSRSVAVEPHIPTPPPAPRQELKAQLHADSHFLMQRGVFDYSLLVAVARGRAGGGRSQFDPCNFQAISAISSDFPLFFPCAIFCFILYIYIFSSPSPVHCLEIDDAAFWSLPQIVPKTGGNTSTLWCGCGREHGLG